MSTDDQAGAGRREVAYRVFAAEYDDADFEYTENEDDEQSPNYVVTPTGARINRLFAVGVLTEVERVNDEMLRGRVVDPTGAFVVYAGQYQPDPLTALERAEPPQFVAITGKARTFQPEDADVIYTSIRPETINAVDADTRDRWTVTAARHTLDRVRAFADALEREERGDELRSALESEGVDSGLAAGIPLAIDHYGTTTAYLDAIRGMAVEAAEVVAGEREEVEPPDLAPDEGGEAAIAIDGETSFAAAGVESGDGATAGEPTSDEAVGELGDFEAGSVGSGDDSEGIDSGAIDEAESDDPAAATDEMYEFDEDEREEIEAEFGTEFSTGSEIDEPGEADLDAPASGEGIDAAAEADETDVDDEETAEPESEPEPAEPEDGAESGAEQVSEVEPEREPEDEPEPETEKPEPADEDEPEPVDEAPEPEEDQQDAEEADIDLEEADIDLEEADIDLEEAVVEAMHDLDSGDGADRAAVVEAVSDEHGASAEEITGAIQDALMSGKCYEPGDGLLKPI